jgi:PAS domain S-box-containing protein
MERAPSGPTEPIRVLYADGDPATRHSVARALDGHDRFEIETVPDVQAGIDWLASSTVDCVVTAYELPDGTGIDFLEWFRDRYPEHPFIIYAATGTEAIASEAIGFGVTDYLQRDADADEHGLLADRIETAVAEGSGALAASLLSRAMEEAPIGISITDHTRPDEPLIYVNEQFQELTGYDETAALGRNCRFLQGEGTDRESVDRLRRAIEDEESTSVEVRNYKRDGTSFWNRVTIAPLADDGPVTNFVGFQEDVTEARERDRRQRTVLRVLRELYDITTDTGSTFQERIDRVLDLGTDVLELPYGFLTEIETDDEEEPDGVQTVVQSTGSHPRLQPDNSCPLSQAYCRKTLETDGLLAMHDAVEAGWEDDPAYETFDLGSYIGGKVVIDGELYGTLCFAARKPCSAPFNRLERTLVRLISKWVSYELEHRETTSELEHQNERLEEFASVVSHDVQNPLNVAQGRLGMAREECESPHLEDVADALDRIEALVTDLLDLARHGDTATDLTDVDLAAVLEECWGTVETSDATLRNRTERTLRADESQLKQLLENLVGNAIAHGGERVTVTVGDLEDGFFVEDDGTGIPPDERESVFEAGYTRSEDGTGFGLNIVQQVAQNHGWEVSLAESETGGARFEFTGVTVVNG